MNTPPSHFTAQVWHTDDFLVQLAAGQPVKADDQSPWTSSVAAVEPEFGVATLALLPGDSSRQERLSALRDTTFSDRDVAVFGARTRSAWALNVLAGRFTKHAHDWASLRAAILEAGTEHGSADPVLEAIGLDKLADLVDLLHERNLDLEVERALDRLIAAGLTAGRSLHERRLEPLLERLLRADEHDAVRALLPKLRHSTWVRHSITAELRHPRFGGSFEAMLRLINEPYRRVALEPISLREDDASTPFARLASTASSSRADGPLVSVIMTCFGPGPELSAAVQSIIAQSYQNWELLLVDDGSPRGIVTALKRIAALDSRIRTVRRTSNAGTFVRRNEALLEVRGEFVTMHDADDWSHPRRLEIQVNDLLDNPTRLANVVNAVRVDESLSLVGRPGAKMFPAEPSLMFRREEVTRSIGFFDSVRLDADREFRVRIERATGTTVPILLPGAPLMFMLDHDNTLAEREYGLNLWNRPEREFYRSGAKRFGERIESDEVSPYVPFPLTDRPFAAPRRWCGSGDDEQSFDLLVVLDGREFSKLKDFHRLVVRELEAAVASGLRVAVLQSLSLTGPRGRAYFTPALQDLVDAGAITRVDESDSIVAAVVVVRHAGAAQGHDDERRSVATEHVVIVEERIAGDRRGSTFARPDVTDTVAAWLGVEPRWETSAPALPPGSLTRVALERDKIAVTITTGAPSDIREVRLTDDEKSVPLRRASAAGDSVSYVATGASLEGATWSLHVDYDAGNGRTLTQVYPVTLNTVTINSPELVGVRTEEGALRVLASEPAGALPGLATFSQDFLAAPVTRLVVDGDKLQVTLAQANAASVSRLYALRVVNDQVVRRRDFTVGRSADGSVIWERPLAKFADSRWRLYASFRTPLGLVEYPLQVGPEATQLGTSAWVPRVLSGGRIIIAPPQPGRAARARQRVRTKLATQVDVFRRLIHNRASVGSGGEHIRFDPSHGEPRVTATPTVTVVMPVYNVEPYLDVAISSVLNQSFADIELILIDDASTDDGRRIIWRHWQADPRVRVFALDHNTIGGAGVPSNIGIRAARGEYVAFADSDDHVTEYGLARLVGLAEAHEAELVIGDFKTFSDKEQEGQQSYDHKVWGELPLNSPISAVTHPALFRLSPVPWRKLYRRSFLQKHRIEYPEGDYFYEDNPLHWFVLSRANTVVMCDEVISYHRMDREGQTMSAATYKLGAFVSHMNSIYGYLRDSDSNHRDQLFEAFFNYLARTNWVANNQTQEAAKNLIRHGMNSVLRRAMLAAPDAKISADLRPRLDSYDGAYPDADLTVVVPVFNSADLLEQTVDSVLSISGLRFNVLLVDDGSTDASLRMMEEYERAHTNVHVFSQGNRGAGRARNSVIPLCTGRYTFFLDADDVIDPEALVSAVVRADAEAADLMLFQYRFEFADEGRFEKMPKADRGLWRQLRATSSHGERQRIVAQLINYPWNRIIRTSLLHDENIFFGATVVNNDVQYHWHSIVSARRISVLDKQVCTHRKFATRDQVTNIQDERRMAVLEAIRSTHERISTLEAYTAVRPEWEEFANRLLTWAEARIPESLRDAYQERKLELMRSLTSDLTSSPPQHSTGSLALRTSDSGVKR